MTCVVFGLISSIASGIYNVYEIFYQRYTSVIGLYFTKFEGKNAEIKEDLFARIYI